jgi:hypothetical protein
MLRTTRETTLSEIVFLWSVDARKQIFNVWKRMLTDKGNLKSAKVTNYSKTTLGAMSKSTFKIVSSEGGCHLFSGQKKNESIASGSDKWKQENLPNEVRTVVIGV